MLRAGAACCVTCGLGRGGCADSSAAAQHSTAQAEDASAADASPRLRSPWCVESLMGRGGGGQEHTRHGSHADCGCGPGSRVSSRVSSRAAEQRREQ